LAAYLVDALLAGPHNRRVAITYAWRSEFENAELRALHAAGFGGSAGNADWRAQVERHSLGWVCARQDGELLGFVNVAWDGGTHAFILDTVVSPAAQRRGVGTRLVAEAAAAARAAGCQWLHVDFEDHLAPFYYRACGFGPTGAGLIALT
jgi:ribosomal protein S18 acetylase RimI-like enzyme